jgi:5'-phosphate synthase pdxT subunit
VILGILALQGDVREHEAAFADVGVATRPVRRSGDLANLDGIVLPGGESTTLSMLLESSGLFEPLAGALAEGLPAFGTCAGLVLLSRTVLDGRADQRSFGVLDCTVRRNGYGRQRFSFESVLDAKVLAEVLGEELTACCQQPGRTVSSWEGPLPAVFIRAPLVVDTGPGVEVLATLAPPACAGAGGRPDPVVCRQGPVLASAFHPELTADRRLHLLFAHMVGTRSDGG